MNLSGAPKDILIEIFMKLDPKFLVRTCNLVCKQWYQILEEDTFWLVRATNENCREILPPQELVKLVRNDYRLAKMFIKRPFNRNLIVETYDEKKSTGWNNVDNSVLNSRYSDYVIIKPPTKIVTDSVSIENFIEYNVGAMKQNIKFEDVGMDLDFLRKFKPTIIVSEFYQHSTVQKGLYLFKVSLVSDNITKINKISEKNNYKFEQHFLPSSTEKWNKWENAFRNYSDNISEIFLLCIGACVSTANTRVMITFDFNKSLS